MLQENENHSPALKRNKMLMVGGLALRKQEGLLTRRVRVLNHFLLSASPPTSDTRRWEQSLVKQNCCWIQAGLWRQFPLVAGSLEAQERDCSASCSFITAGTARPWSLFKGFGETFSKNHSCHWEGKMFTSPQAWPAQAVTATGSQTKLWQGMGEEKPQKNNFTFSQSFVLS